MTPVEGMAGLRGRVQRRRWLGGVARTAGLAVLGAGIGSRAGSTAVGAGIAGTIGALLLWWEFHRQPVTMETIVRHLDRVVPELEESSGLLVTDPSHLTTVAVLQRERVAARMAALLPTVELPGRRLRQQLWVALLLAGAGIGIGALSPGSGAGGGRVALEERSPSRPMAVTGLTLRVEPPGYTGLRAHSESGDELLAEEGARLIWSVRVSGEATAAAIAFSSGDTLTLLRDGGDWTGRGTATAAMLLRLVVTDTHGERVVDQDRRLAVRPDRPPVVTLVQPTGRSEFAEGIVPKVAVEALAADDYGVDSTYLALTIATGRGEQVKFERRSLPFARRERRADGGLRLGATLDLKALGMGPGDELYFHVEATDRKTPEPGHGRSETAFLVLPDTASAVTADFAGITLAAEPEYFRSQRQIIIDTRKLIVDGPTLPGARFRERSNEIGIDQGLLRLRYGQFLGEEFEETEGSAAEAPGMVVPGAATPPRQPDLRDEFTHKHDDTENATLLGASVKTRLKASVNAMWQAELHLRTADPVGAIPFEERALELLKSVQQESRAYVQRVGFESPPIEVDRLRLTGKQDDVRDRAMSRQVLPRDSLIALRQALQAASEGTDPATLQAAGDAVAPLAVNDPRLLPVLHALRRLHDSLSVRHECDPCRAEIVRRLYPLLPTPDPVRTPVAASGSALAERYLRRLAEGRP